MALGRQIVYLVRLRNLHGGDQGDGVGHVGVDEVDFFLDVRHIAVVHVALAAPDAVYFIAFFQQQLCQVGTVLTGDTGNQCFFHFK